MLNFLKINDFALIENAESEFGSGFTVITGESGAGKSILMSSIEMLAGGRAEKSGIRSGCRQYTVSGEFTIPRDLLPEISPLLESAGIDFSAEDPRLTLRRTVTRSAARNFINDIPVGARLLAEIGGRLIDLHGANEQVSLTIPARQLALLDDFGDLGALRRACADKTAALRELEREKEEFERDLPDAGEADRLSLIAEEIDRVAPSPGEDAELTARQRLGANAKTVLETLACLTGILTENEDGIADQLGTVYRRLTELARIAPSLTGDAAEICSDLQTQVSTLSGRLAALTEKIDLDPGSLAAVEARLSEIHMLKRRYGPTLEQVFALREKAERELRIFNEARTRRAEFAERKKTLEAELHEAARRLSDARKRAAGTFLKEAEEKLSAIGFSGAELRAEFTEVPPGADGMDHLELLFNANRGEELHPLRKVASSGELSRIMLALKTVLADADRVPTVIFDEIDMNIGGETANKVAEELCRLGRKRQIFCISHLAQVAARADTHLLVEKRCIDGRTVSRVRRLDDPVPELARMLGGGASAMRHAAELHKAVKPGTV